MSLDVDRVSMSCLNTHTESSVNTTKTSCDIKSHQKRGSNSERRWKKTIFIFTSCSVRILFLIGCLLRLVIRCQGQNFVVEQQQK